MSMLRSVTASGAPSREITQCRGVHQTSDSTSVSSVLASRHHTPWIPAGAKKSLPRGLGCAIDHTGIRPVDSCEHIVPSPCEHSRSPRGAHCRPLSRVAPQPQYLLTHFFFVAG